MAGLVHGGCDGQLAMVEPMVGLAELENGAVSCFLARAVVALVPGSVSSRRWVVLGEPMVGMVSHSGGTGIAW